jgi:predicted alpha/beta hydrolase family esterase
VAGAAWLHARAAAQLGLAAARRLDGAAGRGGVATPRVRVGGTQLGVHFGGGLGRTFTHHVRGALLVAPGDVERIEMQQVLPGWSPIARSRLPFASTLVVSRDDPYCSYMRASALGLAWGARLVDVGACGHINAESNLGDWPQGHALLEEFLLEEKTHHGH